MQIYLKKSRTKLAKKITYKPRFIRKNAKHAK